jgi:uncharacterized protein (DUF3084 family)
MAQGASESSLISHLITCLNALGINEVGDLYAIQENLKPFNDALNPITTANLQEKDITPDTSIINIIKKMTDTLKSNKITSFKELSNLATSSKQIKAKLGKINTEEQKLIAQFNAINMSDEIVSRDKKIDELNKEIAKLRKSLDSAKSNQRNPLKKRSSAFKPSRK